MAVAFARRAVLAAPALLLGGPSAARSVVTLLSGAPPGSAGERWVHGFAPFLERHLAGGAVRVAAIPGDRGLAAARAVAAGGAGLLGVVATPLLLARATELGATRLFQDLTFVAAVVEEPLVLVAHPQSPQDAATLRGGGPALTLGTPPAGTAAQLAARALAARSAAIDPLAFADGAAARKAVATGSIPTAMLALPEAIGALRAGKLVAVAVAQTVRSALLPEVPTLAELGLPVALVGRRGIVAPRAGTTPGGQALDAALAAVVVDPEFVAQADEHGLLPRLLDATAWSGECRRLLRTLPNAAG